jgi:hypothetical protein
MEESPTLDKNLAQVENTTLKDSQHQLQPVWIVLRATTVPLEHIECLNVQVGTTVQQTLRTIASSHVLQALIARIKWVRQVVTAQLVQKVTIVKLQVLSQQSAQWALSVQQLVLNRRTNRQRLPSQLQMHAQYAQRATNAHLLEWLQFCHVLLAFTHQKGHRHVSAADQVTDVIQVEQVRLTLRLTKREQALALTTT